MSRWLAEGGSTELTRKSVPKAFGGNTIELQLAVLGDTIILFIDGKRILKARDNKVRGAGMVGFGVNDGDAEFRNPRFMVPTPQQMKQLIDAAK